jgi:CubicO group peptidase (beta-lactamase class C family)
MRTFRWLWTVALVVLAAPACAQERSPAARRVAEVVELINVGNAEAARGYVERNYSERFKAMAPMERHVGIISMFHRQTGGLKVEEVTEPEPGRARVLARSELTGEWLEISFEVETEAPHRIGGLLFRPAQAPPGRGEPAARTDEERVRALDAYVRRLADANTFTGVVMLAKEGRPLFASAYGHADREANRANTLETAFNLASVNKMITAVAIAQLVEAGKLSFKDPIGKFLPNFPNPRAAREIRIEHLLTHTSGLGSYLGPRFSAARAETVDEMMRFATDTAPAFAPGSRWSYSNTGFLVLGKVIEKVTGQSYFAYVRDRIYTPAGMRSTSAPTKERMPGTATGYDREGDAYTSNLAALPFRGGPAGGGYSTAGDLARFAEALRTGKLVSPAMVRTLTTPKPEIGSPEYGYGFTVDAQRGIVGHSGGYSGTSNNVDIFLEEGYTAIVLSNRGGAGRPIVARMRELVRGR